jgi:outer membrane receptor for ferrienterochelin and colicins
MKMNTRIWLIMLVFLGGRALGQGSGHIYGTVTGNGKPLEYATIVLPAAGTSTDSSGHFLLKGITPGEHALTISAAGFETWRRKVVVTADSTVAIKVDLKRNDNALNEVVVTGTMREVSRKESAVPVEVYTPKFFLKNPTPSLFESVNMINGVMPQLNCNICNTGDIHINGMEGPYTLILIDGMPIVSGLATVYGLSGIPNSLVERLEVVKGPASSLYGSEAMGGTINVITKDPQRAPALSIDLFGTSWQEYNVDVATGVRFKKANMIAGINYFNYNNPLDKNGDGFTDVTIQNRISVFNKWSLNRPANRVASLALRYVYEDRWGGQLGWNKQWRGSDSVYGESIYTGRYEVIGMYQLPLKERIMMQFSYNLHDQDSWYGKTPYMAQQQVAFGQVYWDKNIGTAHNLLAGATYRYTYYDDNTPGTAALDKTNAPAITPLPGIFVQEEWIPSMDHKLLLGYRLDYDKHHGYIHSPRLAWKWAPNSNNALRAAFGTGFRVVNLFTEDHAALTGAREVVIAEELLPERSYNSTVNYTHQVNISGGFINFDATAFYSYFTNKIVGDFDTDPNKIIYDNIDGYAISRGASLNTDVQLSTPLTIRLGITYMDVYQIENDINGNAIRSEQLFAPHWTGNFTISTTIAHDLVIDITGKMNGPMRLPIVPNDFRPDYSPVYCIANVQVTKKIGDKTELYCGAKNLLNFLPSNPILRPFDPFDKYVADPIGNPNGYTFDPSYSYAPMQGIRLFAGLRYNLKHRG